MVAKWIPNPQDEVRFLSALPVVHEQAEGSCTTEWACAEGGVPALQAGFLGALPSRSTELASQPSCAAVRLPMQHDGRAPRWYRGGFGSIPNVGSGSPESTCSL